VNLWRNLAAGFRLACTGRARREQFAFSIDQVVLLAVVTGAFAWVGSYLASEPPRDFYLPAIESVVFRLALALGFAYLATRFGSGDDMTPLVVVLFALVAFEQLLVALLDWSAMRWPLLSEPRYDRAISVGLWGWVGWVSFAAVRLTSGLPPLRIGLAVVAYLAALWSVVSAVPMEPFFATDTWSGEPVTTRAIDAERVLFDQRERVERALDDLTPQRPGRVDLYFVGFAGDASQAVFRREVGFVRRLFERDFDAQGRAVSLINSERTLDRAPLASLTNLAAVLAGIGRQMDVEQDVLFLFLTSHGSEQELAVDFAGVPLHPIAPVDLRSALDEAGIHWRVIVISSCFSGSFVESLEGDETLLITASAADRESFGCSHEAEFTYFGRAFFYEQLSQTRSFEAAFAAAAERIESWERSEDKEHSLPQIVVGSRIRPVLRAIEAGLARDPRGRAGLDAGAPDDRR